MNQNEKINFDESIRAIPVYTKGSLKVRYIYASNIFGTLRHFESNYTSVSEFRKTRMRNIGKNI